MRVFFSKAYYVPSSGRRTRCHNADALFKRKTLWSKTIENVDVDDENDNDRENDDSDDEMEYKHWESERDTWWKLGLRIIFH